MGARTSGREAALQMLYALDIVDHPVDFVINAFWRDIPGDVEGREFADTLVRDVADRLAEVDEVISSASRHWRIERMARVDRNILRLGVVELQRRDDTPRAVIIDEAVELAKQYGSEGSSVFVNGVLDRIAEDLGQG